MQTLQTGPLEVDSIQPHLIVQPSCCTAYSSLNRPIAWIAEDAAPSRRRQPNTASKPTAATPQWPFLPSPIPGIHQQPPAATHLSSPRSTTATLPLAGIRQSSPPASLYTPSPALRETSLHRKPRLLQTPPIARPTNRANVLRDPGPLRDRQTGRVPGGHRT